MFGWFSRRTPGCVKLKEARGSLTFYRSLYPLEKTEYRKIKSPLGYLTKLVDPRDERKLLGFKVHGVPELLQRRGGQLNKVDGWGLLRIIEYEVRARYNRDEISSQACLKEDSFRKEIQERMGGFTLTLSNAAR